MWHFFDQFGIGDSEMVGFWQPTPAVNTTAAGAWATAYIRYGQCTLISLASWASGPVTFTLHIDWARLGLAAAKTPFLVAPGIPGVQTATKFGASDNITLANGSSGYLLWLEEEGEAEKTQP
jgi:hypothetical protein